MKKKFFIIVILFFVTTDIFSQFRAAYIPEDKLPFMKMDGDPSDWDWVPSGYLITKRSMNNLLNNPAKKNAESWECMIKVAWSDLENEIFILAMIFDDVIINNNPKIYLNDCMQIAISPYDYGSGYRENEESYFSTIQEDFILNANDTAKLIVAIGPKWLEDRKSDYIKWSINRTRDKNGRIVTIYEAGMSLWDKWSAVSLAQSVISNLYPCKRIRLGMVFNDANKSDNSREGGMVDPM
ncbi:MAG: hypothetical protein AB2L24_20470 [Mangrovibacterium sp.]